MVDKLIIVVAVLSIPLGGFMGQLVSAYKYEVKVPPKPVPHKVHYVVVEADSPRALSDKVSKWRTAGFQCVGGVSHRTYVDVLDLNNHVYCQAVEK